MERLTDKQLYELWDKAQKSEATIEEVLLVIDELQERRAEKQVDLEMEKSRAFGAAYHDYLLELRAKPPKWNRDIEALKERLEVGKAIVIFQYGMSQYAHVIVKYDDGFYYTNTHDGSHGGAIAWLPWEEGTVKAIEGDYGVLRCSACNMEIVCDNSGDLPDKCASCGCVLNYEQGRDTTDGK